MTTLSRPPADPSAPRPGAGEHFRNWLLFGLQDAKGIHQGPGAVSDSHLKKHSWWQVMCLTGVDYFSTLGYQPAIAALAAGVISPLATLVLVAVTLLGALPVYRRVAGESPRGEGSIAMLERLLPRWGGKLLVLVLLGFAATDFMITMTLSAADATAHALENPFAPAWMQGQNVAVTLFLLALLAAVFLRGFKEAIGVAVVLVGIYLGLNVVVVITTIIEVLQHPVAVDNWWLALTTQHGSPLMVVGIALLVFPKLALGLSGFETGVAVMPQIRGHATDTEENPQGRIKGARRLLTTAALIMSAFLVTTSFTTVVLIPAQEFQPGGQANGRALAYLAHEYLGNGFGTVYDLSTIAILWFAGASAMAGLLNLVPRYLPRYGMAPEWARAVRPLVLVFTARGVPDHLAVRRRRRRPGRRLRHRRPGPDDVGGDCRDAVRAQPPAAQAQHRLRHHRRRVHLHHGGQHLRAARRHPDRGVLHPRDHRDLPALAHPALLRAPRHACADGHPGPGIPGRQ